jgi:glucose-6-phosphate isomerase
MESLAQGLRHGIVTGSTGRRIRTVVNIGIGGSDLGPSLMYEALQPISTGEIACRFVSNVDPADLTQQLQGLDPGETLIVMSSKTFTTSETMANATVARQWLTQTLGEDGAKQHLVAVSANARAVSDFGISEDRFFPLWEWVGGRFSLGSAVGLSAMISLGPAIFREFLEGQRMMDRHVEDFSGASNAPLVMALIGVWNRCALGYPTRAVLPYSYNLRSLPAYLQQLIMESNGKGVHVDGTIVSHPTTPVIWGGAGTDAQHAFMQFIHQSPDVVPVDFLGFARASTGNDDRQRMLFMNLVAQAEALAFGRTSNEAPHRSFPGNRPSTVIVAPALSPFVFGQIIALYEHAVFFEGALLDINSFDQWGVELGKELAQALMVKRQDSNSLENSDAHPGSRRLLHWFHHQSSQHLDHEQSAER